MDLLHLRGRLRQQPRQVQIPQRLILQRVPQQELVRLQQRVVCDEPLDEHELDEHVHVGEQLALRSPMVME